MSKQTVNVPASAIKDMVEGSGRIKSPRSEAGGQVRSDRNGNDVGVSTDVHDTLAPVDDVDGQIVFSEMSMREIIGAPIEADDVSELASHDAPDPGGEAPGNATTPNVEAETGEPPAHTPADWNDKTDTRSSVDQRDKTSGDTASTAPPAQATLTEDNETSVPTTLTTFTKPSETTVPTPQTVNTEPSCDSGDARHSTDTAITTPSTDTDSARRTVKQRKSDLDEYKRRFMPIPKIEDRKPVFVSRTTRDRLDRIVRLLGERGMSVSRLVENIALRHLETHEADIEHWRKM